MIIGVDAAVLAVTDQRLKVGVYHLVFNLLLYLSRIDKKNKYLLYSFDPIPLNILEKLGPNWVNSVLRPKKGWLNLRLSAEFLFNKPDIFLGLGQALPIFHPAKNIIFVYDLAFELYPKFYSLSYKRLSRQTKFAVKNCDKIIAISHATKNDLVKLYNTPPNKISVIYPGVGFGSSTSGESWLASPLQPATPEVYKSTPYFLFVGSYKPGKNIPNIAKAFELFLKEIKIPYRLVLTGSDYWGSQEIIRTLDKYKLGKFVKLAGFADDKELVRLYKGATAFVSPSYYEGFGIPILEAMTFGVPVIASNRGSLTEVTGAAALLVNPDDIYEIKKSMVKVALEEKLRSQMIKKGIMQAKRFSWEKSASELLKIINLS